MLRTLLLMLLLTGGSATAAVADERPTIGLGQFSVQLNSRLLCALIDHLNLTADGGAG